jgi:hypothetical protein
MEKGAKICPQLFGIDKPGIKYTCRKENCGQYDTKLKCCGIVAISRRLEDLADAIDQALIITEVIQKNSPFKKVRREDIE